MLRQVYVGPPFLLGKIAILTPVGAKVATLPSKFVTFALSACCADLGAFKSGYFT